jgi:hypothetical protein
MKTYFSRDLFIVLNNPKINIVSFNFPCSSHFIFPFLHITNETLKKLNYIIYRVYVVPNCESQFH